ncbi:MAG: 30S ribosomal protein S17 [Candidatus Poribacteria bacterium]|nr:30S ribosomal protein S17 [Candidatus Poribacteria bacterium]MDE0316444.1 30S ribosomal protein S17 [Candidatus Poribacteria bacterium]MDE0482079.1 30S ribosomal protein S17 [Candidatus Poribacteria bacterium]
MEKRRHRKIRTGTVVSDRMEKTISVAIVRSYQHPLYKKVVRATKKILAHDEQNNCKVGDVVQVIESRPISKRKRWRVQSVISAAQTAD